MGTRHLIAVMIGDEYKVAQYGQWDGYPEGQGKDLLAFLSKPDLVAALRDKAPATRWITEAEHKATWTDVGADLDASSFVGMDVAKRHTEKYPHLSRDTGAGILDVIAKEPPGLALQNSLDFAADSLFCEWAYVIDFDKGTFEVYKGFNKSPLPEGERFAHMKCEPDHRTEHYAPVRLAASWPLSALPTAAEMIARCSPPEEGEENEDEDGEDASA